MQKDREPDKPHGALPDYYRTDSEKHDYLENMFNTSARHYDRVLRWGFLGLGDNYRLRMLKKAGFASGMRMLDIACGTGVIMRQAVKISPASGLTGVDPSAGMLAVARETIPGATFRPGRAEAIPFEDGAFDFLVMGYALRHVETFAQAFNEFFRVLKPGGKVLILEISRPETKVGYLAAKLYLKYLLPAAGMVLSRDKDVHLMMRYYWDSIDACASRETILAALGAAGFMDCKNDSELGLFSAFSAVKPVAAEARHSNNPSHSTLIP